MPAQLQATVQRPTRLDFALTHGVYGLHAVTVAIAFAFADELVRRFLCAAVPSLIGLVINYVRRDAVRGTFLASDFQWQIRTFWKALLWITVAILFSIPLMPLLVGFVIAVMAGLVVLAWISYRMIRGWIRLASTLPVDA